MLTARSTSADRVQGLQIGADDYMVKPFHLQELLLRVRRMLERAGWYTESRSPSPEIVVGRHTVNVETLWAEGPHGTLQLTTLEAKLLAVLTAEPNRVLSRAELLERVWLYTSDVETRTVDNFILRLRKYFEDEPDQPKHFVSVRGKGYMYVP
jgi:DNA-binding response OmpR family regulator